MSRIGQLTDDAAFRRGEELWEAGKVASFGGLWGGSFGLVAARLAESVDPVLVITPGPDRAERLLEDLRFFGADVSIFPQWESFDKERPDHRIARGRLAILRDCLRERASVIVAPIGAVLQPVPSPISLQGGELTIAVGEEHDPEALARTLVERGFERFPMVTGPAEVARRGCILDVFPQDGANPVRVEFFGDEVEEIRHFDPVTQRSLKTVSETRLLTLRARDSSEDDGLLFDFLPAAGATAGGVLLVEAEEIRDQATELLERFPEAFVTWDRLEKAMAGRRTALCSALPIGETDPEIRSVERYSGPIAGQGEETLARVVERVQTCLERGRDLEIVTRSDSDRARLLEILEEGGVAPDARLCVSEGELSAGFTLEAADATWLTGPELFGRKERHRRRRKKEKEKETVEEQWAEGEAIDRFFDLSPGDYVVHRLHGIGRYHGIEALPKGDRLREYFRIEYRDNTTLHVPVDRVELIQRYVGIRGAPPRLDKLGGKSWQKKKERAKKAVYDLAADLIEIQARRAKDGGTAFDTDDPWVRNLEAAFPYQETPDQLQANEEIKKDLAAPQPMDRLICGDVGFGKTELALRAAFRVVCAEKQVAMLVPTTVLAQQHYETFRERLAEYPVRIGQLSRFRTGAEQRELIREAKEGKIDILIGTHRLLSRDVRFRDLGLVIVDEEQRFGVAHKMKLKQLRATVDVLTLTATPIPRTLHMALLGIKDISCLQEPPRGRRAIRTEIARPEKRLIRDAILRELVRDGQVFFVHNRVRTIGGRAAFLSDLVPEARTLVVHGQMDEQLLEERMLQFIQGEADVLVTTSIIESGVDIPRVNTILIDRADRFGLASLHQLRGRVGRADHQAYCYLLLPEQGRVKKKGLERLRALVEFDELGAGFKIAMRDLEIRGAGNILGAEQSGHIANIGYELYCRLLKEATGALKGDGTADPFRTPAEIALEIDAVVPGDYIPCPRQKLEAYRRISRARSEEEFADLRNELRDRHGPIPEEVELLLAVSEIRNEATLLGVKRIHLQNEMIAISVEEEDAARLFAARPGARQGSDPKVVYFRRGEIETPLELLNRVRDILAGRTAVVR